MQKAVEETRRRRQLQEEYNKRHGITPETVKKNLRAGIEAEVAAHSQAHAIVGRSNEVEYITEEFIAELEAEMLAAAESLEFERAAAIRDRIQLLRKQIGKPIGDADLKSQQKGRRGRRKNTVHHSPGIDITQLRRRR
jgi:excinuclease ABC subunit B